MSGLIPAWISAAAVPGSACLLVAAVITVVLTNGGAWLALGLIGFAIWIVFMAATSICLLCNPQVP